MAYSCIIRLMIACVLAAIGTFLAFAPAAFAQTSGDSAAPSAPPATTQAPPTQSLKDWRAGMTQVPLPKKGCFTSSYPSTEWQEVPCTTPPAVPNPPARGPRPLTVGNGNDVSAEVTGHISTAVGSFDSVTGVTSETGEAYGETGQIANAFTLQLNSNTFTTSTCSGAGASCVGWQQFVYSNVSCPNCAYIQYWLINYDTTCPGGWYTSGSDCYTNSSAVTVPAQTIANLGNLTLMGQANSGGMDALIFSTGSTLYAVQAEDSVVYLAQGWKEAEFNIFGDCCAYEAYFNSGSTIVVRTSVDYGSPSAPSCYGGGYTGETNNLSFATATTARRGTSPAVVFTESSSGGAASACASATALASGELTDTHDFNRDGYSDIAWRNTNFDLAIWLMNGTTVLSSPDLGNVPSSWTVVGQRDFNGDGHADLLWRNSDGDLAIWFMNGTTVLSSPDLGNVPTSWTVVGTGDFNGDGYGDILWRNTNGDLAIWLMNGTTVLSSPDLGNVPTSWTVVGTGDFNGDGKTDILWRNSDGDLAIWLMNGTKVTSSPDLGNVPTSWTVAETGDFNGDGKTDILWRNSDGDVAIWFMNGTTVTSSPDLGNVPTSWVIQGAHAD